MATPPLSPPIAAPVSICSAVLEIGGLIPGANVVDTNGGRNVLNEVATATRQVFPLEPGQDLAPRTPIEVMQTLVTGESSPPPDVDLQVQVMREPTRSSDLGAPEFVTPFCRCGECLYLAGCYPGAEITLTSNRGDVLAESKIVGTAARLSLTRPLQVGEVLTATQSACGIDGPSISSDPVLEVPDPYPNPVLDSPLLGCDEDPCGILNDMVATR